MAPMSSILREQRLVSILLKKKFNVVCIEGCWPEAFRVNRYVRSWGDDREAIDCLHDFKQFPSWMWANADILDFVGWLRDYNDSLHSQAAKVGFYGIDLYSLNRSAQEVLTFLRANDADFFQRSRGLYQCLNQSGHDTQSYALLTALGLISSCENDVFSQHREFLQRKEIHAELRADLRAQEEYFSAVQNSRVVCAAEHYYRTLLRSDVNSWNIRERQMVDTVEHLAHFYRDHDVAPKMIIWAHNSHIGNATGCDRSQRGETNIGQILKDRYVDQVVAIGFTTYAGTVTAASNWSEHSQKIAMIPALSGSCEDLFHAAGIGDFFLNFRKSSELYQVFKDYLPQRAIGVIYRAGRERISHYYFGSLAEQYEGVIHIDQTSALEPLENRSLWEQGFEAPETYPTGM